MASEPAGAGDEPWPKGWDEAAAQPRSPTVLAYEARRCHVCGVGGPAYGFGPPLAGQGQELWACSGHRAEVERLLRGDGRAQEAGSQAAALKPAVRPPPDAHRPAWLNKQDAT